MSEKKRKDPTVGVVVELQRTLSNHLFFAFLTPKFSFISSSINLLPRYNYEATFCSSVYGVSNFQNVRFKCLDSYFYKRKYIFKTWLLIL